MKIPKMYKIILVNVKKADETSLAHLIASCFKYDEDSAKFAVQSGQKLLKIEFQSFPLEIAEVLEKKCKEFNERLKLKIQIHIEEDKEESNG